MTRLNRRRRSALVIAAALALAAIAPAAAAAHIQVRPARAAPLDPVLWTVLVPNEGDEETRRVDLQVPEGVIPFSFQDQPGWKREIELNPDQSIERIVWTGRLASDGLAEFSFLATSPETEGTIAWKALQTYEGGRTVRWIGDENADEPASFTTVSADAPRQNAGGEGSEGGGSDEAPTPVPTAAAVTAPADDGDGPLPLVLAALALVVALASLGLSLRR